MNPQDPSFEMGMASSKFSLLYPPNLSTDQQEAFLELSPAAAHDLGVNDIIAAFVIDREHQKEIRNLFCRLPRDPNVITYRQDVLEDLLANPELVERLVSLLPVIDSLFKYSYRLKQEMNLLHEMIWRAGELQNIIDCFEWLGEIFHILKAK